MGQQNIRNTLTKHHKAYTFLQAPDPPGPRTQVKFDQRNQTVEEACLDVWM